MYGDLTREQTSVYFIKLDYFYSDTNTRSILLFDTF